MLCNLDQRRITDIQLTPFSHRVNTSMHDGVHLLYSSNAIQPLAR